MWTDNETKTDLIGFKIHADLIRNVVTDEKVLPTVLGIFGDWGGGKSSIMQMLQQDLETDVRYKDDVVCLYLPHMVMSWFSVKWTNSGFAFVLF